MAGLVIGDRALKIRAKFKFKFDLGLAWKEMTGLPFVFAIWVAKKQINGEFTAFLNKDFGLGLSKINSIIKDNDESNYPMDMYFRKNISYVLSEKMMAGMELFLSFHKNS